MSLPSPNTPQTTELSLDKVPLYVSVLLPLAVQGLFTYQLPTAFVDRVEVGMRVVVQFGAKRYYTGLVMGVLSELPADIQCSKLKPVVDVVDKKPLLLPTQLHLWQWMARYYMCEMQSSCPKMSSLTIQNSKYFRCLTMKKGTPSWPLKKPWDVATCCVTCASL